MTILELSTELDERAATMTIHCGRTEWVVWLYANDDPAIFYSCDGTDLQDVIRSVFRKWDGEAKREEPS